MLPRTQKTWTNTVVIASSGQTDLQQNILTPAGWDYNTSSAGPIYLRIPGFVVLKDMCYAGVFVRECLLSVSVGAAPRSPCGGDC